MRACEDLSEDARLTGALNTLVTTPDGFTGHNTDVQGFHRFLERDAGFDATGKRALIFGAGGAARAVLLALARSKVDSVTIAARDTDRGRETADDATGWAPGLDVIPWGDAGGGEAALVVDAAPAREGPAP